MNNRDDRCPTCGGKNGKHNTVDGGRCPADQGKVSKARRVSAPREIVGSIGEAVAKMRAAADKHLDNQPEAARQEWAERTARAYIAKGLIAVRALEVA